MPNTIAPQPNVNSMSVKEVIENNKRLKEVKVVKRGSNGNLNKDAFLKLLMTKLSKQDPLKPVSDENFIAQMAQFSALEQMNNVSKEMKSVSKNTHLVAQRMGSIEANSTLGKHVSGKAYLTGKTISGLVTKVRRVNEDTILLTVNNKTMRMQDVESFYQNVSRETIPKQTYMENQNLKNTNSTVTPKGAQK